MRNLTILILCLCIIIILSCTNTQEEYNKQAVLKPKTEKAEKTEKPKKLVDKDVVKMDIKKNNDQIRDIEKEINALLKDF